MPRKCLAAMLLYRIFERAQASKIKPDDSGIQDSM
jgi:hypothetical protein